jgi:hypothetical protein
MVIFINTAVRTSNPNSSYFFLVQIRKSDRQNGKSALMALEAQYLCAKVHQKCLF